MSYPHNHTHNPPMIDGKRTTTTTTTYAPLSSWSICSSTIHPLLQFLTLHHLHHQLSPSVLLS